MKQTKRRLKNWVKVAIIIIIDIIIYSLVSQYGALVSTSLGYCMLVVIGWTWLFFGQFAVGYFLLNELDF